jgi:hypothetical protein
MKKGLTSWCFNVGKVHVIWRHNMRLDQFFQSYRLRRFRTGGYLAVGPAIIEW